MGLVDKNYPIFFYRNLPKSATGRAFDEVVTPSGKAIKKQAQEDEKARQAIEGKFAQAKRRFNLN